MKFSKVLKYTIYINFEIIFQKVTKMCRIKLTAFSKHSIMTLS